MRPRLTRFVVALGAALSLCAGVAACGTSQEATVTIVVPWNNPGPEYRAFYNVVNPFAQQHHFRLTIVSTSAYATQLAAGAASGELPDLVDLPSPGAVEQYEKNRVDGITLKPLHISLSSYYQPWQDLAESMSGTVYVVPVKADVKSLIWYEAGVHLGLTWGALQEISRTGTPWCLGLNNGGSASGWPGADWVADILLSKYGEAAYESWLTGTWAPSVVGDAWQTWGTLIRGGATVPGGVSAALDTNYSDAITETGCELEHGALAATGLPSSAAGYSYERFPPMSGTASLLVSGDFMGLFTHNPYARMLLEYLATYKAQEMWVQQVGGDAFSADSAVPSRDYPTMVERSIADLLKPGTSRTLCFSAEDIMAPDLSADFEQAILEYVTHKSLLRGLLTGLRMTANAKTLQSKGELYVEEKACYSR